MKTIALILTLLASLAQSSFSQSDLTFPHNGVILGDKVRLRQEPSTKGTLITELPFGTAVDVLKLSSNSEKIGNTEYYHYWVQVQTPDGKKGWVFGKFISEFSLKPNAKAFYSPIAPKGNFQWAVTNSQYTSYIDWAKYSEDMAIGNVLCFLVDANNLKALYPIRDPKSNSSTSADNYFQFFPDSDSETSLISELQTANALEFTLEKLFEGGEERTRTTYTVQWKSTEFVITKTEDE